MATTVSNSPTTAVPEQPTYGQILKATALVGSSQALNTLIGIVRAKAMALLLGPAGVGLFGLYGSISNLAQSIAGMGISSSGVRQIAEAAGTGHIERIARTAAVLRRTSIVLGLLGAALLVAFSRPIATLTFGDARNAGSVALLSVAVFCTLVSGGQSALIQGLRRISDLAKLGVLGALLGTIATIPLVYLFREKGVVPSLIAVALMALLTSSWYSRRARVDSDVRITAQDVGGEARTLLKLGLAFMASSLMTMGSAYMVRIIVLRTLGFEATGLYQSAWSLGGLYVSFILQAMSADFYPRLTASSGNNPTCNRLVNEQARISLLLAGPGLVATLTFAPLVMAVFYSARFAPAVGILRWICLGATMQVMTWPMGFIIIAKSEQTIFFACELAWTAVSVGLAWFCVGAFGIDGAGIAFFGSYVFHYLLIYPVVRRLSGFTWSAENRVTGLLYASVIAGVFCALHFLPRLPALGIGAAMSLAMGSYSSRAVLKMVPLERMPLPLRRVVARRRSELD